jgi:methylated-DNA-[protein]-cysteine S-methyltransferase
MSGAQRTIPSPLGDLVLTASETGLTGICFPTSRNPPSPEGRGGQGVRPTSPFGRGGTNDVLDRVEAQLKEYFAGSRTAFDVPLEPTGTEFQLCVWELLRRIPYGATTSYGELARRLGDPHKTRAVGAANGANPIPIIVPCHRVVGSKGELTGFGGGLERKRWLLEHEGALMPLG